MTAGLEINVIQPWKALAMCLCVFYQGPWLEGKEKGVLFVPSRPVIIFIMNLSLSFRQLGPVPIWRDLQSTSAALQAWLFPEIAWLEIQSLPPFFKRRKHSSTEFQSIYIQSFHDSRIYYQEKMRMIPFSPLPKQTGSLAAKVFETYCLSYREASYHSVSSEGQSESWTV